MSVGGKIKKTDEGIVNTYGFAQYLRWSFPNATYCGFTGTPINESIAVFGEIVDSYTMKEASDDGITVRIAYEPATCACDAFGRRRKRNTKILR